MHDECIFRSKNQCPPFAEYLKHKYETKEQRCIKGNTDNAVQTKVIPYKLLTDELFDPVDQSNVESSTHTPEVAKFL